jgi:hypothetical protein
MTADVLLDSNVIGDWADFDNRPGIFAGQGGFVQDYGVPRLGGLRVVWDDDNELWRLAPGAILASYVVGESDTDSWITVTTSGKFVVPGGIKIPADSIADHSRICVRARVKRSVSNTAAPSFRAFLGTEDSTADSLMGLVKMSANKADVAWLQAEALFSTAPDKFFATGQLTPQGTDDNANISYQDDHVSRTDEMFISLTINGGTSGETFRLVDFVVWAS